MKVDLKRAIATYTAPRGRFEIVSVDPQQFLMVDGRGDPNTVAAYRDAVSTLYPLAYALKFLSKRELGRDHVVMPLEALWWAPDMSAFTTARDKSSWQWTLMILVPDRLDEGRAVQTLHVGRLRTILRRPVTGAD